MDALHTASLLVLVAGLAGVAAVAVTRLSRLIAVPAPAIFLAIGMAAAAISPRLHDAVTFEHIVKLGTFGLVLILFEGGFQGGWNRTKVAIWPILSLGVVGTLATTVLVAAFCHWAVGLPLVASVLIAVALSPTDPAAVFSVLGSQEVTGRSDIVLEGESGANDPVGIALMIGAIDYYTASGGESAAGTVALHVIMALAIGCGAGAVLGLVAREVLVRAHLGTTAYHSVAGLGAAFLIFAATDFLHGSGFLAVFVAGLVIGNVELSEHTATANVLSVGSALAEMTMFFVLGVTMTAAALHGMFGPALVIFAVLSLVIRPAVVAVLLAPVQLARPEKVFVAWGGLKGAVPILLATFPVLEGVAHARDVYAVVFVAVAASIVVQGTTLPALARRSGLLDEAPR